MDEGKDIETIKKTDNLNINFEKLFKNIDYLIEKGKGYSIFNGSDEVFEVFTNKLEEAIKDDYKVIQVSNFNANFNIDKSIPIIIYQDLKYRDLLKRVDDLVNRLIYPAWYKGCTIFFISKINKSYYNVGEIQSSLIHSDYMQVINLLSMEQMNNILDLVNVNITSPELINDFDNDVLYTPIEKIFKDKLVENNISFEPQVKLGRFYVDFLIEVNNTKVIIECDGREYHNPYRDHERDKELKKEGYKIFRFSGSRIFNDCDACIDEVIRYSKVHSNSKYVLEGLNDDQKIAVNHITGPMRVLAPAGSGKTKTLVNRIVNLINNGVQESEILALAFNKKAQKEMTIRLSEKYGISSVSIKTFHSFGNDIIKKTLKWRFDANGQESTTKKFLRNAVKKHGKITYQRNKDPLDEYLDKLRKVKNDLLPINEMVLEVDSSSINFEPIFNEYLKNSFENNFYNFDDMLYIAVRQLLSDPILRRKIQDTYKYILVDEFQDLNKVQLLLLQILALPENNLFIVGDDDQMIYGFRGAEVRHILQFDKRYSITSDQVLKINYRSCSDIVRHSKWLIDNNKIRVAKDIIPFSEERGNINLFIGESLKDQAERIAQWILKNKDDNTNWSDFAILYRYNQYSDLLRIILSKLNIPVEFEGIKVLNSSVGKCILSYLTIIYDNKNSKPEHYKEILNKPNKYFTNDFIKTIRCWDDFINLDKATAGLRQMDVKKYTNLVSKIKRLSSNIEGKSAGDIINAIVEEFGLKQFYKDMSQVSQDIDSASAYDTLEIIISFSQVFDSIEELYKCWINLSKNEYENFEGDSDKNKNDKVVLTTIHKTKGNEYKNVAYYNLSSKVIEKATETKLEEERRIAYVGVTRPKKSLIVTTQKGGVSPFVREFFLNPKLSNLSKQGIQDKIGALDADLNVFKVELKQFDEKINELTTKYPELKGECIEINGLFKKIKQKLRNKSVNVALNKYKQYNEQKNEIYEKVKLLDNKKIDFQKEVEFREIIKQGSEKTK